MDVLGRRNGAEKRKWASDEPQVYSIHNVGYYFILRLSLIFQCLSS